MFWFLWLRDPMDFSIYKGAELEGQMIPLMLLALMCLLSFFRIGFGAFMFTSLRCLPLTKLY